MAKTNINLRKAEKEKNDEFYTQLYDIGKEMHHYWPHFENKTIYCNCDDPKISNFFVYFSLKFKDLKLKKLMTTCYRNQNINLFSQNDNEHGLYTEYTGTNDENQIPQESDIRTTKLKGDGDFRSEECIEILKQADIVITNPPFSLFREYIAQLMEYDKKFIVIGNMNAMMCKEIFPHIQKNKIWLGANNKVLEFEIPQYYEITSKTGRIDKNNKKFLKIANARWFTNLEHNKRNEEIFCFRRYKGNEQDYPKYDNYDAINIDKTTHIPEDYTGIMGVPISFMDKYNPNQFEILDSITRYAVLDILNTNKKLQKIKRQTTEINKKPKYGRIIIKHKQIKKTKGKEENK